MTPQLDALLRVHEPEPAEAPVTSGGGVLESAWELPPDSAVRRGGEMDAGEDAVPSLVRRESLRRRLLAGADVLSAMLALIVVLDLLGEDRTALTALAGIPIVIILFKVAGLYDRDELRIVHSTLDEAPLLMQLTGLFVLGVTILQPVVVQGTLGGQQIAALWLGAFGFIVAGRVVARSLAGRISPVERCLVIGELERADRICEKLASSQARAAVVAILPLAGEDVDGLAAPEAIRRIVGELHVHRIIIAPTTTDAQGVAELIRIAKAVGVRVSVLPRMFEVVGSVVEFDDVDGMTMLGVRRFGLTASSRMLKRAFDVVGSALGLLAIAPVLAVIAAAIRLDSKGPMFFRQVRVGRDGTHFSMFKFRSMVVDADAQKDRLRLDNEAGDGLFKIADDPRVTRVGCFLRRTSLDELPQLFNVLRGEMSLVGPRPLVVDEDARVLGLDRSRLHLTPGMTGPWQVLGTRVPMQEMLGIDYLYVASWSLWLDLKLLLRTVGHVARRGNV
jgi:exopolysaccharide biosynthesis polyprenyl glycosylphosphotransferase